MQIISLKFVSESKQGMIYDVEYKTEGNWLNRGETLQTKVFLERSSNDKFYSIINDYYTGKTMPGWRHLFNAIMHDYEINVKQISTFSCKCD